MKKITKSVIVLIIIAILLVMQLPTMVLVSSAINAINSLKQKSSEDTNYEDGEVIIMYKKSDYATKSNTILNELNIVDSVEFKDAEITENTETITKKSKKSAKRPIKSLDSAKKEKDDIVVSLVKSDKYSADELIKKLNSNKNIIHAQKNYKVKALNTTNDTYEKYQWAIENNGQNAGTEGFDIKPIKTENSEEKVVAIIDTGVDYTHPDLENVMWTNPYGNKLKGEHGYDFVNNDDDPIDDNGHGTHCAGIIAAQSDNEKGTTGAILGAENIKIMALKFLNSYGGGSSYGAISAYNYIYTAQKLGTNIVAINNSWGGWPDETDDILNDIIDMVGQNGALSLCAAGNDGMNLDGYYDEDADMWMDTSQTPACLPSDYIISVAASNENDELATFSNYGINRVDIAAPGTDILSTVSYNVFNPSIYTDEQKANVCSKYEDFNNGIEGFTYKATEDTTVEADSSKYFGTKGGKSLEWSIGNAKPETKYNLVIPITGGDCLKYYSMMLRISNGLDGAGSLTMEQRNIPFNEINLEDIEYLSENDEKDDFWTAVVDQNYWDHIYNRTYLCEGVIILQFVPEEPGSYSFNIDDFAISKDVLEEDEEDENKISENEFGKYDFYNGTSMATPYVTAAVATVNNLYKGETALQIKERILGGRRFSEWIEEKVATNGTLDLTNLDSVGPEITSITIDNDGKIEVKGNFFGENPVLYIDTDINSEEENYKKVDTKYNKETQTITYVNKDLKNKNVLFKVERSENKKIVEKYKFLKFGKEFDEENLKLSNYENNIVTDGKNFYYVKINEGYKYDLIKLTKDGKTSILDRNGIYDLFNIYKEDIAYSEGWINWSSLVYINDRIYAIARYECQFFSECLLVSYDLNENNGWKKVSDVPGYIPEDGFAFTTYNSNLYIIGGISEYIEEEDREIYSKNVYMYDISKNSWEKGKDLPEARSYSEVVQVENKLVLMFGNIIDSNYSGEIAKTLIFDGNDWNLSSENEFLKKNNIRNGKIALTKDGVVLLVHKHDAISEVFKYNIDKDKYEDMNCVIKNDNEYYICDAISLKDRLYTVINATKYKTTTSSYDVMEVRSLPIESGMVDLKINIANNGATVVNSNKEEIKGTESYLPGTRMDLAINAKEGYYLKDIKVNGKKIEGNTYNECITSNTNIDVETGKYATSIRLDKTEAGVETGKALDLVAILDEGATNKAVTWRSSNENVAAVDANGKVTAKEVGEATITATTTDGTNLSAECKIKVAKTLISINNFKVSGIGDKTYSGQPIAQRVTVANGNTVLREGIDYTISYSNNTNPGKATLTIVGTGDYTGTIRKTFIITPRKVSGLKLASAGRKDLKLTWNKEKGVDGYKVYMYDSSKKTYKYLGQTSKNTYTVKNLKEAKDYKFKVRAYKTIDKKQKYGSYSSVLKTGTKTATPEIWDLTSGKKKLTVEWGKISKASGYEVYVATSKNGKYTRKKTIKSGKTTTAKIKGLKSKKKYYVKVRTYRTVDGKKIYSSFSSKENIKVK